MNYSKIKNVRFWLGFKDKKQLIFLSIMILISSFFIILQNQNPTYYLIIVYIGIKGMDYFDDK